MDTSYREKLAHLVMVLIILAIVGAVCWYLRSVLTYVALALVLTVLSLPFNRILSRVRIRSFRLPDWLCAMLSITVVFVLMASLVAILAPLMRDVTNDVSRANVAGLTRTLAAPLSSLNEWVRDMIPSVGPDFKVEKFFIAEVQKVFNASVVRNFVGSITSFIAGLGVMLFAVLFIAFFLLKKPAMLTDIVVSMVPDQMEERTRKSIHEISDLIARYFVGVSFEVLCVWMINFLGLWLIARMGFKYSISIAFLVGILNLIPYIGPLIGCVLSASLCMIIHYAGAGVFGLDIAFFPFLLVLLGISVFAQMIDNYVLQPLIYSSSVKVHPLEIFIVFLIAAQLGGMIGMLAAIPVYTILRVIAREFFGYIKPIKRLTSE